MKVLTHWHLMGTYINCIPTAFINFPIKFIQCTHNLEFINTLFYSHMLRLSKYVMQEARPLFEFCFHQRDWGFKFRSFVFGTVLVSFILRVFWSGILGRGAYPASYSLGTGGSFPAGKAAGEWSWPLTSI